MLTVHPNIQIQHFNRCGVAEKTDVNCAHCSTSHSSSVLKPWGTARSAIKVDNLVPSSLQLAGRKPATFLSVTGTGMYIL